MAGSDAGQCASHDATKAAAAYSLLRDVLCEEVEINSGDLDRVALYSVDVCSGSANGVADFNVEEALRARLPADAVWFGKDMLYSSCTRGKRRTRSEFFILFGSREDVWDESRLKFECVKAKLVGRRLDVQYSVESGPGLCTVCLLLAFAETGRDLAQLLSQTAASCRGPVTCRFFGTSLRPLLRDSNG